MKKIFLLSVIISLISLNLQSQHTTADIFTVDEITFYGLDFSNIKLVGSEGFTDPYDIKDRLFGSWNSLFKSEPEKYNMAEFLNKKEVPVNLDIVRERNELPDPKELVTDEQYSFGKDVVENIISQYQPEETEGIGLVFIMESFNKKEKHGSIWVTFFDVGTNKVLLAEKLEGKAKGFGIRNYYANTYYSVLKDIEKKQWEAWSKKY